MYQSQSRSDTSSMHHYYTLRSLIFLSLGCACGTIMYLGLPFLYYTVIGYGKGSLPDWVSTLSVLGGLVLFGESIVVMLLDYQGMISLRGVIKTRWMRQNRVVNRPPWLLLLYALTPWLMLPLYIIRACLDARSIKDRMVHREILRHREKVVELEAQRGILPALDGVCGVCRRPLVIDARFCQYCGTPVILVPKVCPQCLTSASPDAAWCPKCRNRLSSIV